VLQSVPVIEQSSTLDTPRTVKRLILLPSISRSVLRAIALVGACLSGIVLLRADGDDGKRTGPDWWSLRPIARPALPTATGAEADPIGDSSWVRNPIDAFVLRRLQAEGLRPAPAAGRISLIRRATFDLIGLPPTPDEIDAFLEDNSPDAYERLVDRLLASPQYGERWARHWLDVARFAESQGFERDIIRDHAWRYRDYVIQSFNDDQPYDQFVREQIAGDVTEPIRPHGIVATGFLVAGPYDEAGNGSKSDLLRARIREEELEDTIGTMSQAFLGLTVNCARCHDHKFDPISQRDYYRMKAIFDGVRHGNRAAVPPSEVALRQAQVERLNRSLEDFEMQIAEIEMGARAILAKQRSNGSSVPNGPAPIARWRFETDASDDIGELHGTLRGGARIKRGRLCLSGAGAYVDTGTLNRELKSKTLEVWASIINIAQGGGGLISVEELGGSVFDAIVFGEREPKKWIAGSEGFQRTKDLHADTETIALDELVHIAVVYDADNRIQMYRNGMPYGEAYFPTGSNSTLRTFAAGKAHILFGLRHTGAGNGFFHGEIEEARLYDRALTDSEVAASFQIGVPSFSTEELVAALTDDQRATRAAIIRQRDDVRHHLKSIAPLPQVYAANPREPEPTYILLRGDVEKKGDPVTAGALSCISNNEAEFNLSSTAPEADRRIKFADWVTHPNNPLTARVMVNRMWHYHFGRGIVGTPSDFGWNGDRPSHPELLDWLASKFIASGWSMKHLHKLIMLSSTYRQSSQYDVDSAAVDADDRLLWRFPPRRLEGETIRDAMLLVSGELNWEMLGPSFRPFEVQVFNSHFYNLNDPVGAPYNRRTVYRINVNSAKDPLLESMDCPDPSTKTPKRSVTTTPIQALGLMNNSFVQRQAHEFAARLHEADATNVDKIKLAYRITLGRLPSESEIARAIELVQGEGWEPVCWALFNSSEFQYLK
jgi:Protein of unknown function (DUF1553)/Protein of unknown function (DUF1549)/Concanavalin A-like lectin/glucanases superfamily